MLCIAFCFVLKDRHFHRLNSTVEQEKDIALRLLGPRVVLNYVEEQFTQSIWRTAQFNERRNI